MKAKLDMCFDMIMEQNKTITNSNKIIEDSNDRTKTSIIFRKWKTR